MRVDGSWERARDGSAMGEDGIGWDRMGVRWCELEGMGLGRVLEYGRVGGVSHCCCEMF